MIDAVASMSLEYFKYQKYCWQFIIVYKVMSWWRFLTRRVDSSLYSRLKSWCSILNIKTDWQKYSLPNGYWNSRFIKTNSFFQKWACTNLLDCTLIINNTVRSVGSLKAAVKIIIERNAWLKETLNLSGTETNKRLNDLRLIKYHVYLSIIQVSVRLHTRVNQLINYLYWSIIISILLAYNFNRNFDLSLIWLTVE